MKLPDGDVAVVLGSGLASVASRLAPSEPVPYSSLDGFPVSAVAGHEGNLYQADRSGRKVLLLAGRMHLYEGYDAGTVTSPVRAAVGAGCKTVILTNAAGGIAEDLDEGDLCLIVDHLNLTGTNPLAGPDTDPTNRFLDMVDAYDLALRGLAHEVDPGLKEGIYAGLAGPSYETPAEVKMLRTLGADLVGMSTVLETIAARHAGARVLGLSVVTNKAAGTTERPLSHSEVTDVGRKAAERLASVIEGVIARLD